MGLDISIREATLEDIPEVLRHRRGMFEDMDYTEPQSLASMVATSEQYLSKALVNRSFRAWFALAGMRVAGGGAVVITPWPSHPYDLECRRATILNLYVYPEFRRQGIARRLMQAMIDWCQSQGFAAVSLHASEDGRHLYEALGFKPTNEMRLGLKQ